MQVDIMDQSSATKKMDSSSGFFTRDNTFVANGNVRYRTRERFGKEKPTKIETKKLPSGNKSARSPKSLESLVTKKTKSRKHRNVFSGNAVLRYDPSLADKLTKKPTFRRGKSSGLRYGLIDRKVNTLLSTRYEHLKPKPKISYKVHDLYQQTNTGANNSRLPEVLKFRRFSKRVKKPRAGFKEDEKRHKQYFSPTIASMCY